MGHTAHGLHPKPAGAWSAGEQAGWALQRPDGLGGSQEEAPASQERGDSSHAGVQTDALLPRVGQIWAAVLAPLPLHLDGGAGGWGGSRWPSLIVLDRPLLIQLGFIPGASFQ